MRDKAWMNLLQSETTRTLPWVGGEQVHAPDRIFRLEGKRPREFGWYDFKVQGGRKIQLSSRERRDAPPWSPSARGYVVGDRFISDAAHVDPLNPSMTGQSAYLFGVPEGLGRFARAAVWVSSDKHTIFLSEEWPTGPEAEVEEVFQDRGTDLRAIKGVTPALELAFRWQSYQRLQAEEAAREAERRLREEEARLKAEEERKEREAKLQELLKTTGSAVGRRAVARQDFAAAARAALAVTGAELLDTAPRGRNMLVKYRLLNRRLECLCHAETLQIVDAGVCLDDHAGTKSDTWYTLESLPAVIAEAIDRGILVVWGVR